MRNKRSRIELYYHILKTCADTKVHTRGSLNSKLLISFGQLNDYLFILNDLGLLEIDHCNKSVSTTLKGKEFVKKFDYLTSQVKIMTK
jgi:predicted transcriptional regulator